MIGWCAYAVIVYVGLGLLEGLVERWLESDYRLRDPGPTVGSEQPRRDS